jgi:O-antigen ligase
MKERRADAIMASPIVGGLLWIAASSATLVETDTYRYACGLLALIGLRVFIKSYQRPAVSWIGWLCMGWAGYALLLFLVMFAFVPGHPIGESEFLYLFPFFFPVLGVALVFYWRSMEPIIASFFVIALFMLLVTTHFRAVAAGETVRPLIQNNQIHGAVCCGMVFVGAGFWSFHYLTDMRSDRRIARLSYCVAPAIMLLSLFCIYGAKSKGVWLALAMTLPVVIILVIRQIRVAKGIYVLVASVAVLVIGTYAVRANVDHVAGPTMNAAVSMIEQVGRDGGVAAAVDGTIGSGATPTSMDERLQLWWNASELISASPAFGWGNEWLDRWHHTRYGAIRYDLMHNGYLEILIRYGFVGAVVLTLLLTALIASVVSAYRHRIIPKNVLYAYLVILFFFSLTLLSNSNNRLAIGESLALVSSAFACACRLKLDAPGFLRADETGSLTPGAMADKR